MTARYSEQHFFTQATQEQLKIVPHEIPESIRAQEPYKSREFSREFYQQGFSGLCNQAMGQKQGFDHPVFDCFFPRELFSEAVGDAPHGTFSYQGTSSENGMLRLSCDALQGHNPSIELRARTIAAQAQNLPENMVVVSEFNVSNMPAGGTRIFVENFEQQVARIGEGSPIVVREAPMNDLPYLICSQLSYVPVPLLKPEYKSIASFFNRHEDERQHPLQKYNAVVQWQGKDYSELVTPDTLEKIKELKQWYQERLVELKQQRKSWLAKDNKDFVKEFKEKFTVTE